MLKHRPKRVLIVGDGYGVPELLERVPSGRMSAIIAAENRPQYHEQLQSVALDAGVKFFVQPHIHNHRRYDRFMLELEELEPDGLICHSYSMLIRPDLLQLVSDLAFNVHASLLPKNRGPNPVQWALIHGENKTGVTLHVMDVEIDSGAIIDQQEVDILASDTWHTLMERVRSATGYLLDRALPTIFDGTWESREQDSSSVTVNRRIAPESLKIEFSSMTDLEVFNLIRAQVSPLAGAYIDGPGGRVHFPRFINIEQIALLRREYS